MYLTSDPIGLRGGKNTYRYAEANPLTRIDITGLSSLPSFGGFQFPGFGPGSTSSTTGGTRTCRGIWIQVETLVHPFHPAARLGACSCGYVCSACDGQNVYNVDPKGNIIPTIWRQGFASADPNDPESPGACNCTRPTNETGCVDCD